MEHAIQLYQLAVSCFGSVGTEKGGRLVLSLFFKAVLGVQRVFHFDSLTDVGFAVLTGGKRILSRDMLGGLVRAVSARSVNKFVQLTQPLVAAGQRLALSIDEHTVPRFTRKFLIKKGFHTIRNKKMRAEKLFFSFASDTRTLLDLIVTPGNGRLARIAGKMIQSLRKRRRSAKLRVVLDAGAAQSHSEMLKLVDDNPKQVFLIRTPRRAAYVERWKAIPEQRFTHAEESGRYKDAPAKRIHITETTTTIRANRHSPMRKVRTIVVREEKRTGKDRWHAVFVFGDTKADALSLIKEFRARQHHEQTYRVLLHDAFVDTAPSGYYKKSPNPDRPGFRKGAITLYAWVTGLAVNALVSFTTTLPKAHRHAHPRTLRRWWLNFPADLYITDKVLFVVLRPRWFRRWWENKIPALNARKLRVPWMNDRLVLYSLDKSIRRAAEPATDPDEAASGVWC